MNVYIETHGCKLNISDSQKISDQLQSSGLNISDDIASSDIYIFPEIENIFCHVFVD